ncbi:MAG: efflux RND transporter permease subunit [Bryobacteraceae bacterium]
MKRGHLESTPEEDLKALDRIHNLSRYFVEHREIAWVALAAVCIWGIYGYATMPQRRDPDVPNKQAVVVTTWPGASAEKIEQLVTKPIEKTIASQSSVARIESVSRSDISIVTFTLSSHLKQTGQTLDDIGGRLAALRILPEGAGPPNFVRDFGDTATLLLTVASPIADANEIAIRAASIQAAIGQARSKTGKATDRASIVLCFPTREDKRLLALGVEQFVEYAKGLNLLHDVRILDGPGFTGLDFATGADDATLMGAVYTFITQRYHRSELPPDTWAPFIVRDPANTRTAVGAVAAEKYSYRELDDFTGLIERGLLATARTPDDPPLVAKVVRSGQLQERIYLTYSQHRLAAYGLRPSSLVPIIGQRNLTVAGGELDIAGKNVAIHPSGEFTSERELGEVPVAVGAAGTPIYLRDLTDTARGYANPPGYLAFHARKDASGKWIRSRAITLSVQMGAGQNIQTFDKAVNATLADVLSRMPQDLIVEHTSDQPQQVGENIELFMRSLYEAILLVVLVSVVGFWEWRAALLMALAIPITLLMTFGTMSAVGIDLQQVSIATLIIALGLLVDDPVVAGDAIRSDLAAGRPAIIAAWLAPTRLGNAILFATITNIVAYLPFLLLSGNTGQFLYSLPVVMTCSLIASRLVSMTFIPLLAYYLLKPKVEESAEQKRSRGFAALYYRVGKFAIRHRKVALASSLLILAAGGWIGANLGQQFFPKDLSYLAYINVTLPEDSSFDLTNDTTSKVEQIVERVAAEQHVLLHSVNSYIGGSAPRFWYSLAPEPNHRNFAQIVVFADDKHAVPKLLPFIQARASREVAGAVVDAWQLETGDAVGIPIQIRLSGDRFETLHKLADDVKDMLRAIPEATRIRDDWGEARFSVQLAIDPDKANLAGVTNLDVATASTSGMNGLPVTVLREGSKQIPVLARLRADERAQLDDINNIYVYAAASAQKVPLRQIAHIDYALRTEVIRRRNQYRTITVSAVPQSGVLASKVMATFLPKVKEMARHLPAGYRLEVGGEQEKQDHGNDELNIVLAVSVILIYLALAVQFKNALKPVIVLAAVPFGAVGALAALAIMGAPFGFMAFLGVISLVGVIVSHIIVLFDFIEEKHAEGEPFEEAVLDAGIMRLRPVLITVGATVMALVPLALHGGPLWEPMCYAQIGGLSAATVVTLLIVPIMYSICVLDLKIIRWDETPAHKLAQTTEEAVLETS